MAAPDIPEKVATQVRDGLADLRKRVQQTKAENRTESDTANLVLRLLERVFGFDPFDEVTSEYRLKGQFADFALRLKGQVFAIIEVKSVGTALNDQHLFQAKSYAGELGLKWAILTNAVEWNLYRVVIDQAVRTSLVAKANILQDGANDGLYPFHKWSFERGANDALWQRQSALSQSNLVRALLSEEVIREIASSLRRATSFRVSADEVRERLVSDVVRPGLIGEVSLSEVSPSEAAPDDGGGSRRVRISTLVKLGFLAEGQLLSGTFDGATATAIVRSDGLEVSGQQGLNVQDAARAAFGKLPPNPWAVWANAEGEDLGTIRDRFIANS